MGAREPAVLAHGNACWTRGAGQHLDARGPSRIRTSQGPAPLRPRARASARTALPPRERVHRTDGFAHARALARVPTRKQADATLRQDVIGRHLPRSARVPRLTLGGRCGGSATNGLSSATAATTGSSKFGVLIKGTRVEERRSVNIAGAAEALRPQKVHKRLARRPGVRPACVLRRVAGLAALSVAAGALVARL